MHKHYYTSTCRTGGSGAEQFHKCCDIKVKKLKQQTMMVSSKKHEAATSTEVEVQIIPEVRECHHHRFLSHDTLIYLISTLFRLKGAVHLSSS